QGQNFEESGLEAFGWQPKSVISGGYEILYYIPENWILSGYNLVSTYAFYEIAQTLMAVDLQTELPEISVLPARPGKGSNRPMLKENQVRFIAALMALMTATAIVFAFINFQKER